MASLENRIERLEAAHGPRLALVWVDVDGNEAEAIAEHLRRRPQDAGAELVTIGWARPGTTFDPARDA